VERCGSHFVSIAPPMELDGATLTLTKVAVQIVPQPDFSQLHVRN
jgi:hypothetical protein